MLQFIAPWARRSALAAGGAAIAIFGAVSTAAASDQTIKVPCAGNSSTTGPNGLVAAISAGNANTSGKTTIKLDSGCSYLFRQAHSGNGNDALPVIQRPITIDGEPGGDETAIIQRSVAPGTDQFRIFEVASGGGNLTLKNITVTGGHAKDGDSSMTGNGSDGQPGGGILNAGILVVDDSIVTGNQAGKGGDSTAPAGNGGKGGDGGGVANTGGVLTKSGASVSGNIAGYGGNSTFGNGGDGGSGGGIAISGGVVAAQDSSTVSDNQTGQGGMGGMNGGNAGDGGGVAAGGNGVVSLSGGNVELQNNTTGLGGNSGDSLGDSGDDGDGGGVFLKDSSKLFFDGAKLTGNTAGTGNNTDPSGADGNGRGGGLFATGTSNARLRNGSITFNAASDGGGIFNDGATVTVSGTKFANNSPNNCTPATPGCPAP